MSTSAPSIMQYRAAAIQYEPVLGEKEKNMVDLLRLVELDLVRHQFTKE